MCLIIHKEPNKGKIEDVYQLIKNAYTSNHDGYGISIKNKSFKYLNAIRGLDGPQVIIKQIREIIKDDDELIVHLRQSTGGCINIANCHPIAMDKYSMKEPWIKMASTDTPFLFHNGVFWSSYNSKFSDTIEFTEKLMNFINWDIKRISLKEVLDDIFHNSTLSTYTSGNKIMIMFPFIDVPTYSYGTWVKHNELNLSNSFYNSFYKSPFSSPYYKSDHYTQTKIGYNNTSNDISIPKPYVEKPSMKDSIFTMNIDSNDLQEYLLLNTKQEPDELNIKNDSILFDTIYGRFFIYKEYINKGTYIPLISVDTGSYEYKLEDDVKEMIRVNINISKDLIVNQKVSNNDFFEKLQKIYDKQIAYDNYNCNIKIDKLKINILHAGYIIAFENYKKTQSIKKHYAQEDTDWRYVS